MAAWPLAARAQQPAMPVMGFLSRRVARSSHAARAAFREGLGETGFVEGRNVAIEYRWAEGQDDRLPALAAELVRLQVGVIAAAGTRRSPPRRRPRRFRSSSPGGDPVAPGLVASLNRPGGNVTGVSFIVGCTGRKRLELLREIVPNADHDCHAREPEHIRKCARIGRRAGGARAVGQQIHHFKCQHRT